jgi:RNA polymerase sigma-70 factor (ECF subfamily)
MNFFFRSLRNEQTSEDLTQLVFIRLHRAAPTYEPSARFSTYLFHIAHNLLLNEHRRASRKPAEPYDPALAPEVASGDDESARRVAEIEEAFAKAIEGLPANQRTAILLHKQQDLGYEEIAAAMGTSVTLVKTWLFRARVKLREVMKDA